MNTAERSELTTTMGQYLERQTGQTSEGNPWQRDATDEGRKVDERYNNNVLEAFSWSVRVKLRSHVYDTHFYKLPTHTLDPTNGGLMYRVHYLLVERVAFINHERSGCTRTVISLTPLPNHLLQYCYYPLYFSLLILDIIILFIHYNQFIYYHVTAFRTILRFMF